MICPLCKRQQQVAGLCHHCQNKLHSMLDDLLEFWDGAHAELTPARTGSGSRSSEISIGLNVNALSFITGHDILSVLHSWETLIRSERKLTPPALIAKQPSIFDEINAAVKFAQVQLPYSSQQEWFDDFVKELKELHRLGMVAARHFVEKTRKIKCPAETADGECGNLLRIQRIDPLAIIECRKCDTQWTTLRLIAVALSNPNAEVWLDLEAISKLMGISERHARRLARQLKISKRGELFDVNQFRQAYSHA